ncbi:MAG: hypothetical protein JXQ87_07295 [Bacteroidia bacterium]
MKKEKLWLALLAFNALLAVALIAFLFLIKKDTQNKENQIMSTEEIVLVNNLKLPSD